MLSVFRVSLPARHSTRSHEESCRWLRHRRSIRPDVLGMQPGWGKDDGGRTGVCAGHRQSRTLSVWQAGRQLSRSDSAGGFQRKSPAVGAYHQARKFDVALLAGGGGAGYGGQSAGMAQPILSPEDAARPEDRQGCHGAPAGSSSVLDDAPGMGLSAVEQVRFAEFMRFHGPSAQQDTRDSPEIVM